MSYQHTHTHTHTRTHARTHARANINSTQPDTLSHRLDTYTLPKPNQTTTTHSNNNLATLHILAQLAQGAGHVLLRSGTAVGTDEFLLLLVLHTRERKRRSWGKRWNSPHRAWSGSFVTKCTLSGICWSQNKNKILTLFTDDSGTKICNSLYWMSLLHLKIIKLANKEKSKHFQ